MTAPAPVSTPTIMLLVGVCSIALGQAEMERFDRKIALFAVGFFFAELGVISTVFELGFRVAFALREALR